MTARNFCRISTAFGCTHNVRAFSILLTTLCKMPRSLSTNSALSSDAGPLTVFADSVSQFRYPKISVCSFVRMMRRQTSSLLKLIDNVACNQSAVHTLANFNLNHKVFAQKYYTRFFVWGLLDFSTNQSESKI